MEKFKKIAVPVVTLVVGFGLGWVLKKPIVQIEEKTKVVEVEKQVVVVQEKVRVEVVKVKDTQVVERWHREKTEEKRPDGTVLTKEVEDKNIDTLIKEKENSVQVKVVEVEKQVLVEKEKIVEKKLTLPDWHVGALVGVGPNFEQINNTTISVGLEAERRIIGPVWVGGWFMANSAVGAFKMQNPTVGLKIGVQF